MPQDDQDSGAYEAPQPSVFVQIALAADHRQPGMQQVPLWNHSSLALAPFADLQLNDVQEGAQSRLMLIWVVTALPDSFLLAAGDV